MAKRRKSSVLFSVESLREEAFAEGRNELIGSKILTDISSINLDQVEHVAEDVVLCALIVKFGLSLVFAIAGVASSLRVLPDLVREEVLKIIFPNVDVGDLRCLYNCVQKLSKFPCFDDLDHPPHVNIYIRQHIYYPSTNNFAACIKSSTKRELMVGRQKLRLANNKTW